MMKASELDVRRLVFPALSAGAYGYPLHDAARVAITTVVSRLQVAPGSLQTVTFALMGRPTLSAFENALDRMKR
jgi:O-acetyl-ADP-ribose deacetylase (regulator of RNase III)